MAKRNYNKISTKPAVEKEIPAVPAEPETDAKVEEPEVNSDIIGIVASCGRLNVRRKPSVKSEVVYEALIGSELVIDLDKSTDEWFKVCTPAGIEGFCMKQFVEIQHSNTEVG